MDGYQLCIKQKMNESGTFYAAVGEGQIAEALKKAKLNHVDQSMITLDHPIKTPGVYLANIQFPQGFDVQIRVLVEAQ